MAGRLKAEEELALRKSMNFHKEIDRANREKLDNPDMYLRYGEKIYDKNDHSYLNSNEYTNLFVIF
jgi:hypothetical protein